MLHNAKLLFGQIGFSLNRLWFLLTGKYDDVIRKLEIRVEDTKYVKLGLDTFNNRLKVIESVLGEQNDPSYTNFKVIKSLQADVSTIKSHLPEAILLQDTRKEYEEVMKTALLVQTENAQLKLKIEQLESDIKELSVLVYAKHKGV